MPKISIIIPVYNAEKYLEECLLSISQQNFSDFEIWAINDGSKDRSLEILKRHQEKEPRLNILSQENKGVSFARNFGIEKSQGKYIAFADADDVFYDENWLAYLFEIAENEEVEIVASSFLVKKNSKYLNEKIPFETGKFDEYEIIQNILPYFINTDNFNAIWSKLYSTQFLKNNHIIFPKMPIGEDAYFNMKAFSAAKTVFITDFYGYQYNDNENSATKNILKNDLLDNILKIYEIDFYDIMLQKMDQQKIVALKNKRFVKAIIASVYQYVSNDSLDYFKKIDFLKRIVNNRVVRENFGVNYQVYHLNNYEQKIYHLIANRNFLKLFLWSYYSFIRNKNK